jgi:two-component system, OmpR family, response regulator RegX3
MPRVEGRCDLRIALLEDDPSQAQLYVSWLEGGGHLCAHFASGKGFIKNVGRESYDLIVLDWGVPDLSGEEVLEWIRKNVKNPVPVMFVTARDEEKDIVTALEKGADDYLVKPVRKLEMLARVHALDRRAKQDFVKNETIEFEPFVIDTRERKIRREGKEIELTLKEFDLSVFMFRNVGQLLSRGHILESIWGRNPDLNTRTVDTHVSRIRNKLGLMPEQGFKLSSVYFYGYRLERVSPTSATPTPTPTP